MAVANTKATVVSNRDASPAKMNPVHLEGGRLREIVGVAEVAAADDDDSVYRLGAVHSSWRISDILIANDAITLGTVYNLGLHETAENGGAAKDDNFFASAVDLSSAAAFRSLLYEATAANIDKAEMKLWELLGESADPNRFYDVTLTGATVGTAAGTLAARIQYSDGT